MDANSILILLICVPTGFVISRPVVATLRTLGVPC